MDKPGAISPAFQELEAKASHIIQGIGTPTDAMGSNIRLDYSYAGFL